MSDTQTEKRLFREASARKLPSLACIGEVTEVGEGKLSNSGNYIVQPISLSAREAGKDLRTNLLYKPEWFEYGFDPDTFQEIEGGSSMESVYRRNISGRGGLSTLSGLAGSDEEFERLQGILLDLTEVTAEVVQEALSNFFLDPERDMLIGYVAQQQRTKTDRTNPETGKAIYIAENRYEVGSYFRVDEKTIKSLSNRAKKSNGNFRLTFEAGVPF